MVPSAGTPVTISDILSAAVSSADLHDCMKRMLGVRHVFTVNSGTTAFYMILQALRRVSDKEEIILPAYTAPSLTLPIKKAGLQYRLVDISPDTFNMAPEITAKAASDRTLAILCVNMFGIPVEIDRMDVPENTHVIEDAASSFGTRKGHRLTGVFGDTGFISLNRGKNLSTVTGGIIVTDNNEIAELIREETQKLPHHCFPSRAKIFLKAIALSYAVRPWCYTLLKKSISRFKYTTIHEDFESFQHTAFQGALGCSLLKRAEDIFRGREEKGRLLHDAFSHIKGIRRPEIPAGWRVAFNQFPIIVENAEKRMNVIDEINRTGLESTMLYDKPIHKIYGSGKESHPHAEYIAERLVLIPVHHYVKTETLYRAVEAVKKVVRS
jgi:dTDP-4-amino-4,6-dideoxygalactose transaminase